MEPREPLPYARSGQPGRALPLQGRAAGVAEGAGLPAGHSVNEREPEAGPRRSRVRSRGQSRKGSARAGTQVHSARPCPWTPAPEPHRACARPATSTAGSPSASDLAPSGRWGSSTRSSAWSRAGPSRCPTKDAGEYRRCCGAFAARGYAPFEEDGEIIASQCGQLTISIEPGGQLELSGSPFADVHVVAAELDRHLHECREIGRELGVAFLAAGYRPWGTPDTNPWMPKRRYLAMRPFLSARGRLAPDMMAMTGSAQVSYDFSSPQDMAEKLRVGLAVQPAVTALLANSPIVNGRDSGWKSYRVKVWEETDPARCGLLPFAFDAGFLQDPYRAYVEWALDVPMISCAGEVSISIRAGGPSEPSWRRGWARSAPPCPTGRTTSHPLPGGAREGGGGAPGRRRLRPRPHASPGRVLEGHPRRRDRARAGLGPGSFALALRAACAHACRGAGGARGQAARRRTLAQLARELLDASADGLCRQHCCGQRSEDGCGWSRSGRAPPAAGPRPTRRSRRFAAGATRRWRSI